MACTDTPPLQKVMRRGGGGGGGSRETQSIPGVPLGSVTQCFEALLRKIVLLGSKQCSPQAMLQ